MVRGPAAIPVAALAQTASGIIDVADDHVRLEIELPWLLAKVAQQIQRVVNAQGRIMLQKK
jgi:putative polyhydroxyalkanoic acid system protein